MVITGDVESQTDLQIAGRVQGDVRCPTLFVDVGGEVSGSIHAERLRVSGLAEGTLEVGDLAVEAGGRVLGTISYARLKVSAGAIIEGNFTHRGGEAPAADAGSPKPAATAESSNGERANGLERSAAAERVNPRRVYID